MIEIRIKSRVHRGRTVAAERPSAEPAGAQEAHCAKLVQNVFRIPQINY